MVTTPSARIPAAPVLVVEDLTVDYGGHRAVDGVSFHIGAGERVALVGESGSGKSSLALAIAGFLTQDDVEVDATSLRFDGAEVTRERHTRLPHRVPGIAMIFQDAMTSLDPVWTVGSQLIAVLRANERLSKAAAVERAHDWLRRVGLPDSDRIMKARPHQLSGGMRQRVMMAIALSGRPRLLIADEPTSALDASLSRAAMDLLEELTSQFDASLLIVSHDIHLCMEYSDRTFVMYRGEMVEQGDSATLRTTARHPYTAGLLSCVPTLETSTLHHLPTLKDFMTDSGAPVASNVTASTREEEAVA
ncbi:ABC transporter ATP-binding protein [Microbacteriaceae bacterium VKM Ac-2855]|nr:ABC transporter ATP-binding protein [Microbacteriaceae bacterium VKM Ac-2855]